MDLKVNVKVTRLLSNSRQTSSRYLDTQLVIKKCEKNPKNRVLKFGQTKKYEIQITSNVKRVYDRLLEVEGKCAVAFLNPPVICYISMLNPKWKDFFKLIIERIKSIGKGEAPPDILLKEQKRNRKPRETDLTMRKLEASLGLARHQLSRILSVLKLQNQNLRELPREFSELGLETLNLAGNSLGLNGKKWWDFFDGKLSKSLQHLDLQGNKLSDFPLQIISMKRLITLNLSYNDLSEIPPLMFSVHGNGDLQNLHLAGNVRLTLPMQMLTYKLNLLDISGCSQIHRKGQAKDKRHFNRDFPKSLKILAGEAVFKYKIAYSAEKVPRDLVLYLNNSKNCFAPSCRKFTPEIADEFSVTYHPFKVKELMRSNYNEPIYAFRYGCISCYNQRNTIYILQCPI